MAMMMPIILDCEVEDCSYNRDKECHALAITVGSEGHPVCDTFAKLSRKGGVADTLGCVGACREDDCKYNDSLECTALTVHVGQHSSHADCRTFVAR